LRFPVPRLDIFTQSHGEFVQLVDPPPRHELRSQRHANLTQVAKLFGGFFSTPK